MDVRRTMIGLMAGAAIAIVSGGSAAAEEWRMAHKMPPDSPEGKVFQKFADLVGEYSDGELTIETYPNEQLGKTDAVLEQLKQGTVHLYPEGSSYMNKWVPELKYVSAAFIFDDREHWVRFMNSDLVKGWYDKAAEEAGIGILGDPAAVVRGPYRVMVSERDVQSFDDVQGLPIRMAPSKIAVETWNTLGADVKTLPWTDVYQAIDKGIVSAVNSPIALVESMRFHEVAPHIIRHDEYYQSISFMMHQPSYEALDPKLQEALDKALAEAGTYSEELMGKAAEESLERMKAQGVTYVEVDREPFIERMQTWYDEQKASGELPEGFMETVEATRSSS